MDREVIMPKKTWSTEMRVGIAFAIAAVLIRIVFWVYTERVWEDALISILHARNAARGLGLTHFKINEGPIHGFTSPLSVLIPLIGECIRLGAGLFTIRIASLVAAAATVLLAVEMNRLYPSLRLPLYGVVMFAGFLAFEHHQTLWGMAGMETQLATCLLILPLVCYQRGSTYALGFSIALALYARPDFALGVAVIGCFLLARAFKQRSLAVFLIPFLTAVATYLPWIIFATWYYGDPVPNTIRAKGNYGYWLHWGTTMSELWWNVRLRVHWLFVTLGPSYGGNGYGGFHTLWDRGIISYVMTGLFVVSVVFAFVRKQRDLALPYLVLLVYFLYYLFFVPGLFGWYSVPFVGVVSILSAKGLCELLRTGLPPGIQRPIGWVLSSAYLLAITYVLPMTYTGERRVQNLVEKPVRRAIGRYLKSRTPPTATIGGEPLGFIGYYSDRTYYEWPGLTSRRSVDFLTKHGASFYRVLGEFRPDYLVLRGYEADTLRSLEVDRYWFTTEYVLKKEFSVPETDRAKLFIPEWNIDLYFGLWERKKAYREQIWLDFDLWPKTPRKLDVKVELSGWSRDGQYGEGPAGGRVAYGSYHGSDANTGRLAMKFTVDAAAERIAVPILTGPATENLSVSLLDESTGEVMAAPTPLPTFYLRWKAWIVDLPSSSRTRSLVLVAEDQGSGFGQWLGIAEPELLDRPKPDPRLAKLESR